MINKKLKLIPIMLVLGLAVSQSFAAFEIRKYSINSGGSDMSGGIFEMKSSIGQVDASNTTSGGNFQLNGGYWHKNNDLIFKNDFE